MSISSDVLRGHTEAILLAHLTRGDSYGYRMNRALKETTGGRYELKEATLYSAFRRLEAGGLIASYWGDEPAGARRRYYTITEAGRQAHAEYAADWRAARAMLDALICGEGEPG